jgi:erythronate-4-phosphate dehydrogenase
MIMKIIADINMPGLDETFGRHGSVHRLHGRRIGPDDLIEADVLLVRSVTRVDAELLQGSRVRFVGSATIGIDHLDTSWLEANHIAWAHAPGCNADAAAQYTLAMMWLACERLQKDFRQQTVGIIGRGNVGRRLEHLLKALEIPVMACDPPLQDRGEQQLVSMQEACANSMISLHVPLTRSGNYPTKDLFDQGQLAALKPGTLLVNASRGGVIEEHALLAQLKTSHLYAALDVWPNEPRIAPELLDLVVVASPHIAGYSLEGKHAGTEMIYRAFLDAIEIKPESQTTSKSAAVTVDFLPLTAIDEILQQLLHSSCPVSRDDAALRATPGEFDRLRSHYPQRYEFKSHLVNGVTGENANLLKQMGFRLG